MKNEELLKIISTLKTMEPKEQIETIISLIADIGLNMDMEEAGGILKKEGIQKIQEASERDKNWNRYNSEYNSFCFVKGLNNKIDLRAEVVQGGPKGLQSWKSIPIGGSELIQDIEEIDIESFIKTVLAAYELDDDVISDTYKARVELQKVLSEILKEIEEKKKNNNSKNEKSEKNTSIDEYMKNILDKENINIQDIHDIPNSYEILNKDTKIEKD